MDIKFLSRKFILSILLAIMAIIFLIKGLIDQNSWSIIMMATVVSYTVSKTIDKKYGLINYPTIWSRIVSMFSREFIVSILAIVGSGFLCWYGFIAGNIWFQIALAVGSAYNIFNSIEKVK